MISYTTCKNWGMVSTIVHIKEYKLTAIIKFWPLKTVNFVIKLKQTKKLGKTSLGAGQKISTGGGGPTNIFFCA